MDSAFLPRSHKRCPDDDSDSNLHRACFKGAYESALMLILYGEDIMARNVWNQTPLHQCTSQGHLDVMLLLLDSGASVNALDHENLTPLHIAVIHSNKHAAQLLLCYGASVHNQTSISNGTRSVLELASHVHVCHNVIQEASGRVWPLQHLCRIAVRQSLGAARRKRMKELPVPKHLLSYLCSLPVDRSSLLHQNWERVRSNKCEAIRKKGVSRRMHQRLDFEVLPLSAGQNVKMAGIVGERGTLAREPDKRVQGGRRNDQFITTRGNNRETETSNRGMAGSQARDSRTAEFRRGYSGTARSEGDNETAGSEDRDSGGTTAESKTRNSETAGSEDRTRDIAIAVAGEPQDSLLGRPPIVPAALNEAVTDCGEPTTASNVNDQATRIMSSIKTTCENDAAEVNDIESERHLNNKIDNEESLEHNTNPENNEV